MGISQMDGFFSPPNAGSTSVAGSSSISPSKSNQPTSSNGTDHHHNGAHKTKPNSGLQISGLGPGSGGMADLPVPGLHVQGPSPGTTPEEELLPTPVSSLRKATNKVPIVVGSQSPPSPSASTSVNGNTSLSPRVNGSDTGVSKRPVLGRSTTSPAILPDPLPLPEHRDSVGGHSSASSGARVARFGSPPSPTLSPSPPQPSLVHGDKAPSAASSNENDSPRSPLLVDVPEGISSRVMSVNGGSNGNGIEHGSGEGRTSMWSPTSKATERLSPGAGSGSGSGSGEMNLANYSSFIEQ